MYSYSAGILPKRYLVYSLDRRKKTTTLGGGIKNYWKSSKQEFDEGKMELLER